MTQFSKSDLVFLRGYGNLKYGNVHEKFIFLEIEELRPFRTCQQIFETILPNFLQDEWEFKESTQWYKMFHVATPIATTVYYKNVTKNVD